MSENGNGELRQLLEVKHAYRADLAKFEADLKAKYDQDLADARKRFQEQYLERIVDIVFAEAGTPAPIEAAHAEAPKIEPAKDEPLAVPVIAPVARCPQCEAPIPPDANFCPQCAAPVKEEKTSEPQPETVVIAGRKFGRIR